MEQCVRHRPVHILVVEDNPGDVQLLREAFRAGAVPHRFTVAEDGEQALRFLRPGNGTAPPLRPDLILLDLNLPRYDGRMVLQEIKGDPDLRSIPVIVLTSSSARTDINSAYAHHANCYVQKPMSLAGLLQTVQAIEQFWFLVARLPGD